VREWERLGGADEALWSGRQLSEAQGLEVAELTGVEATFLAASRLARRRSRLRRAGLLLAVPLALLCGWSALALHARQERLQQVEARVAEARRLLAEVRSRQAEAARLGQEAFALFDRQERSEAEQRWTRALQLSAELQPRFGQAAQELETALLLDPQRQELRGQFADLLLERALLAESRHAGQEAEELLQRLSLYDDSGVRRRRWAAPGTLTLAPRPAGASVTLQRFVAGDRRRFRLEPVQRVTGIALADAQAYVAWLAASGRVPRARLCRELEWEQAARGADGREYPHGDELAPEEANFDDTYAREPLAMGPDEVGAHPASQSPFGLQDMAGNVWEWTSSSLAAGEYTTRGGSWYFGTNSARASDREVTEPSFRDVSVGLRVCADLPP